MLIIIIGFGIGFVSCGAMVGMIWLVSKYSGVVVHLGD